MENILIEEPTKEIDGRICFYYKQAYPGQNILNDIKFKTWINEQEKSKGKNRLLFKCNSCNYIFYLKNIEESKSIKCCEQSCYNYCYICTYCGDNFSFAFYCCKRTALKWHLSSTLLNGKYFSKKDNLFDQIKLIPFLFHILFIYIFFEAFFFHTKMQLKTYECSEKPLIGIGAIFAVVQGFTFFFPFCILYFIYFIIALTGFELNIYN